MQEPHGVGDCCAKHDDDDDNGDNDDDNGRRMVQTRPRFLKGRLALNQD